MALEGTEKGKHFAAQAVAKIAITADPRMAFPGQRVQLWGMGQHEILGET